MSLYNVEVGCGGGIRMVYPTPKDYKWTGATGIHTYIVEAKDAEDAIYVLKEQPYNPQAICACKWEWINFPEPIRR